VSIDELRLRLDLELLNASAPIGFRNVDAAFGIDGESVAVGEVTGLMARSAETRPPVYRLPPRIVHRPHFHDHVRIHRIYERGYVRPVGLVQTVTEGPCT
jgi:hypothetical protein